MQRIPNSLTLADPGSDGLHRRRLVNCKDCLAKEFRALRPLFVWIEVYAVYFFGVAPILHVVLGHYIGYPLLPDDMRPWLGRASLINFVGLVAHGFIIRSVGSVGSTSRLPRSLRHFQWQPAETERAELPS